MEMNFYIEVIIPTLLRLVEKTDITDHDCFYIIRIYLKAIKEKFSNDTDVITKNVFINGYNIIVFFKK